MRFRDRDRAVGWMPAFEGRGGWFLHLCAVGLVTGAVGAARADDRPGRAESRHVWDFEADATGRIAGGFAGEGGRWVVVADGEGHVLAQEARSDDATFNVALAEGTSYQDVDLSVRLRAVAGEVDQGGGLVWRASDGRNYYVARYNPLEDNFRVYKVQDGKRTQFRSAKVPGDQGWHTLRVTMIGTRIACYLDGTKHLEVEDATFPGPGKVGLWSKADARSYFDDLAVALPGIAPPERAAQADGESAPPTREFEIRGDRPYLGGQPIDLWGLRCGNALYRAAVTERHVNNLDNMAAHGINCVGVYIQGANAGWPNPEAGLDGYRRDGRLKPEVARRLEWLIPGPQLLHPDRQRDGTQRADQRDGRPAGRKRQRCARQQVPAEVWPECLRRVVEHGGQSGPIHLGGAWSLRWVAVRVTRPLVDARGGSGRPLTLTDTTPMNGDPQRCTHLEMRLPARLPGPLAELLGRSGLSAPTA